MEIHIHVHHHNHDNSINLKLDKIMGALDDVKAALAKSNEKIDIIAPAVAGVRKDVAFIKAKLEASQGGIDAAGVAELLAVAAAQDEKLGQVATDLQALDAESDSNEAPPQA